MGTAPALPSRSLLPRFDPSSPPLQEEGGFPSCKSLGANQPLSELRMRRLRQSQNPVFFSALLASPSPRGCAATGIASSCRCASEYGAGWLGGEALRRADPEDAGGGRRPRGCVRVDRRRPAPDLPRSSRAGCAPASARACTVAAPPTATNTPPTASTTAAIAAIARARVTSPARDSAALRALTRSHPLTATLPSPCSLSGVRRDC